MKALFYVYLLICGAPALAGPCGNKLVFGAEIPIDPPIEARLRTVGLNREDLRTMVDARTAIYDVDGAAGSVTGSIFARSPKDQVIYRIQAIVDEPFADEVTLLRVVGFQRAPAYMQNDFDRLKAADDEDWATVTVPEEVSRLVARDFVKPANENEIGTVLEVGRGPLAGSRFTADELWLFIKLAPNGASDRDLVALLENDELGGLALTRGLAFDLGLSYMERLSVVVGRLGAYHFGITYRTISPTHFEIEDIQMVPAAKLKHYRKR